MDNSTSSLLPVPRGYEFQERLGKGKFGIVYQCVQQGTDLTVAVKTSKDPNQRLEESMLNVLMNHNLDNFNIIKFYGTFCSKKMVNLMFELLDISLQDYLIIVGVMPVEDVRIVIQQIATALEALKRIGVIHADLKPDNIMMVDHVRQPLKVKLIDFGWAMFRSQAKPGTTLQPVHYRAPEITLGLPFSESIDVWSLGCVMSNMLFGCCILQGKNGHDTTNLEKDHPTWQCIDLIMAMLKERESDRITPSGILNHPFITKGYLNSSSCNTHLESAAAESSTSQEQVVDSRIETLALDVTMVQPEDPMNKRHLEETSDLDSEMSNETFESAAAEPSTSQAQVVDSKIETLAPDVMRVQPEDPVNRIHLGETSDLDSEMSNETFESAAAEPSTSQVQVVDSRIETPAPDVITVQPEDPVNRIHLEETSELDSEMSPHPAAAPAADVDPTRIHKDDPDLRLTTADKKKKKKKKRHRFRRFFSWMRKRVCSCGRCAVTKSPAKVL